MPVILVFIFVCLAITCRAETALKSIGSTPDESFPSALIEANHSGLNLFGTTGIGGPGSIFKITPQGDLIYVHQFNSGPGHEPNGPLVQASDGNFYGVVAFGPSVQESAIFKMTPDGNVTILYQFTGGTDGGQVEGGLKLGQDGNLYGVCYGGGMNGHGTFFRLTLGGVLTTLHYFQGKDAQDGDRPGAPPNQANDGTWYGTTYYGGSSSDTGTIYRVSPSGDYEMLHAFSGGTDGFSPESIIQGTDGNFYGCLSNGGANGNVFKMTPAGIVTTVRHFTDGSFPNGNLLQADDGFIYGTTRKENFQGPPPRIGEGTVFRFSSGTGSDFTILHTFAGDPLGALIQASDRNLYFTIQEGTIFKVTLAVPKLVNISTRLRVRTGNDVLIGGFIVTGMQPKKVIVRAIGPSLSSSGVGGPLSDPMLELHDGSGAIIATNDDWGTTQIGGVISANQVADIQNSGLAPQDHVESSIIATLPPGAYTAIVHGKDDATGVGLVEVYDLDQNASSKLANISTRGFVETDSNVMIGGLIIRGTDSGTLLVKALGPSLGDFGVVNALPDPTLELHDGNGVLIASNDDWREAQQVEIQSTGLAPKNDPESAILTTKAPGNYTAIVRGKNNTPGTALVEVYQITN
jgi:uncharacterized repeat protein (TIGR03803 family)